MSADPAKAQALSDHSTAPGSPLYEAMRRDRDQLMAERDEMRRANVTPEDADRPLGQSVEYWQDRCLDHATALDDMRVRAALLRAALDALLDWAENIEGEGRLRRTEALAQAREALNGGTDA